MGVLKKLGKRLKKLGKKILPVAAGFIAGGPVGAVGAAAATFGGGGGVMEEPAPQERVGKAPQVQAPPTRTFQVFGLQLTPLHLVAAAALAWFLLRRRS